LRWHSTTLIYYGDYKKHQDLGMASNESSFDFTYSNLVLMVGGQILILGLLLMIVLFGVPTVSFPAKAVREMIAKSRNT
jgi:hypothetical protein